MIVSAFSDFKNGVVNFFRDDSVGSNKKQVEYSIIKENYMEDIKNFKIGELKFPTEEEGKKAYESKKDYLHKYQLWLEVNRLANCEIRNKYKIDKGEFIYLGPLEYLTGSHIGIPEYSMNFYNAVFYSYVYLRKPIGNDSPLDEDCPLDPYIPNLKKRFQEARELLGRISLYEEAFKKLDMPEDLEMCLNFKEISIRTISMIVFLIRLIEQMGL